MKNNSSCMKFLSKKEPKDPTDPEIIKWCAEKQTLKESIYKNATEHYASIKTKYSNDNLTIQKYYNILRTKS